MSRFPRACAHALLVLALSACAEAPAPLEEDVARAELAVSVSPTVTIASTAPGASFPAYGDQRESASGRFTSTNALVVYVEAAEPQTALDAVRVDAAGARVGSTFRLFSAPGIRSPALACNAASCLVAFVQGGQVRGVRVDATGALLDLAPFDIGASPANVDLAACDDGSGATIAWSDRGTPSGTVFSVYARRVSSAGVALGTGPYTLTSSVSGGAEVTVASFNGTRVVAWDDVAGSTVGRIQGTRLLASGEPMDAPVVTLADSGTLAEQKPRLLARSSDLVLLYGTGGSTIYGRTVSTSPSLVASTEVSLGSAYQYVRALSVSTDGTSSSWAAVFQESDSAGRFGVIVANLASPLAYNTPSTYMSSVEDVSGADVLQMGATRLVLAAVKRDRPAPPLTNGLDVQAATSSSSRQNVTVGAASLRDVHAIHNSGQFGLAYLEDGAFMGSGVRYTRFLTNGTAIDPSPRVVVDGTASTTSVVRYERPVLAAIGSVYQVLFRETTFDNWNGSSNVVDGITVDQASPPNLGIRRRFNFVGSTSVFAMASGSPYGYVYTTGTGELRDRYLTTGSDFAGSLVLTSLPNVRADGTRAVAWSSSSYAVITPAGPSAFTFSQNMSDDAGPSAVNGTRSTLMVRRNGTSASATGIWATLLDSTGSAVVKATFLADSGTTAVGPARVAFDGTNYDVVFVRGDALHLLRIDEDGNVVDASPSVLAASGALRVRAPAVTSDRIGRVFVAYETFDAASRAVQLATMVIDWTAVGGNANGAACTGAVQCASGRCVDGVCCSSACGLGAASDCQACSVAAGGETDGVCGPVIAPNRVCRGSAGTCDVAEVCDGVSVTCPANGFVTAGTLCGALGSTPCETDQRCTGSTAACPAPGPRPSTTICRNAASACDAPEQCTGASTVCPPDIPQANGVPCRPSAGACDRVDTCNGVSMLCGADVREPSTTVCRNAQTVCDAAERCDGVNIDCPANLPAQQGTMCRPATLGCDVAETCTGADFACPADGFAPTTHVCRAAVDVCDVPEHCSGTGPSCPAPDAFMPRGTVCRPSNGPCDVAETCSGTDAACAADAKRPVGAVCRAASNVCDIAEACSGSSNLCPEDRDRVDGSGCSNGLVCDGAEVCQAGECVAGEALVCEADSPCLESTGQCSVATRDVGCSVTQGGARGPASLASVLGLLVVLSFLGRRRARAVPLLLAAMLGGCVCGVGRVQCDNACVDVEYDERNCGACGKSCGYGQCIEGECHALPATAMECETDEQCTDGNVCNGVERCAGGRCRGGQTLSCDDGLECTTDTCVPALGSCLATPTSTSCGIRR